MKKGLLLLLLSIKLFAQEIPISESNYFVYDKLNYGVTPFNINSNIFQLPTGEVVVSEYSGYIYKIGNTSIKRALPQIKEKDIILQNYFKLKNGIEYYCGSHEVIVSKNDKILQRIKINSQNDFSNSFAILNEEIYFITQYKSGKLLLRKFDGNKIYNLNEIKASKICYYNQLFINHQINIIEYSDKSITIYKYEKNKLIPLKNYSVTDDTIVIQKFIDENNFSGYTKNNKLFHCHNGILIYYNDGATFKTSSLYSNFYLKSNRINKNIYEWNKKGLNFLFNTTYSSFNFITKDNKETNSYYEGTNSNLLRFFPHIKKYPRLLNNSNSSSVFTLLQANNGTIWTGSYQGFLSTIGNNCINQSSITDIMFMNGGLAFKDKLLLFAESDKGALLFSDINNYRKIADNVTFFYAYKSKNNKLYLGSSAKGLWVTDISNLDENKPVKWNVINEKNGLNLYNIITICEDKFGNIWTGRSGQGIAVYNPKTNKAKTWQIDKNEIDFGSMCSVLDDRNTLWFGKINGGLCYYDGKTENDYDVKNFKTITHPLLKNDLGITFMQQWKDYLLLGAKDKILLFNLKEWYKNKNVLVRYLNAQETNFSAPTEQNTCLVDKRDQSIWFATSDMVYQWDIKKWLSLPTFEVLPNVLIKKSNLETEYKYNNPINLKPSENSFDIEITYQTKDNLPRFINGVLVKKNEKPIFENPNLQTKFNFKNLSSGEYVFYVRVCQQDGSFDIFEYPIDIDNFLWQKWWFWLIISLFPVAFISFYFKKKSEIEQTKKKLSHLNLASLSNQFRPHFMLNALNSIGSQMEEMPHAEKVISRLGESVNILYGFTQTNDFVHSFKNEWKLVENIIEIQKLLFIPDLKVICSEADFINENYKIPVGLIQIPVENALLHGLRNKEFGSCFLEINICKNENYYLIEIIDNGVGREKSKEINSFKKNGKGLSTIFEMITIINNHAFNAISFEIRDEQIGTKVIIQLKKEIDYDKIKL